jgi:hypothetical protein
MGGTKECQELTSQPSCPAYDFFTGSVSDSKMQIKGINKLRGLFSLLDEIGCSSMAMMHPSDNKAIR